MFEKEYQEINARLSKLLTSLNADCVVLMDINGQQIAAQGKVEPDLEFLLPTCPAVKEIIDKRAGGEEVIGSIQQVEDKPISISIVGGRVILAVWLNSPYSQARVEKYVSKCKQDLTEVFERITGDVEIEMASKVDEPPDSAGGSSAPSSYPVVKSLD